MKTCLKCGQEKPLDEFYEHPMMADGYLNQCKTCKKAYQLRRQRLGLTKEYERKRAKNPIRKAKQLEYNKRYRKANYARRVAYGRLARAVRNGLVIKPTTCEDCEQPNLNLHAHHNDYSKPLEVTWLCARCHGKHNPNYI